MPMSQVLSASFAQLQSNNLTSSFCSTGTKKHRNSPQDYSAIHCLINNGSNANLNKCYVPSSKKSGERDEGSPQETQETHQEILHAQPQEEEAKESTTPPSTETVSETSIIEAHIDDIIEFKILVANQQATIDTLSTKLHNLELKYDNCQPMTNEQSRMKNLEVENHNLATQLNGRQKRDLSLRKELNSQHQLLDDSNKEQHELEGKNIDLMGENSNLRRQLQELRSEMGCSKRNGIGNGSLDISDKTTTTNSTVVSMI